MTPLDQLESQSIYILREAYSRLRPLAMLWSIGKDSNTMIWLAKKAFFGRVPFPVVHVDTGRKFPEMYAFRERYAREWDLNLLTVACPPVEEIDAALPPAARLLQWTELDIWRYVERERIPVVELYFARDGRRYRSLGDSDITHPTASNAATIADIVAELETSRVPERGGRAMDHEREDAFERLRATGYM